MGEKPCDKDPVYLHTANWFDRVPLPAHIVDTTVRYAIAVDSRDRSEFKNRTEQIVVLLYSKTGAWFFV